MNKSLGVIFIILGILSSIFYGKIYNGTIYQAILMDDFNRTQYFKRPLSQVEQIPDELPALGVTTIPLKSAKAIYYLTQDSLQIAKKLLMESLGKNPYLGMTETTLSEVYFKEKKLDSAEYFARKALKANYRSVRHLLNLQKVYFKSKKFNKADSILDNYKNKLYDALAVEMFYQNHLVLLATNKDIFNTNDSINSRLAINNFPDNKIIKKMNQIIIFGIDKIKLVNRMDSEAFDFFNKKEYIKAAEIWEEAIKIKEDDAYYLNLFQCLIINEDYEKLERLFNEFENLNLNENDGKFEYLKGLYYQKIEDTELACKSFKRSYKKGYGTSKSLFDYLKCN